MYILSEKQYPVSIISKALEDMMFRKTIGFCEPLVDNMRK